MKKLLLMALVFSCIHLSLSVSDSRAWTCSCFNHAQYKCAAGAKPLSPGCINKLQKQCEDARRIADEQVRNNCRNPKSQSCLTSKWLVNDIDKQTRCGY
ncbi:MAG: hypothetical protein AB1641_29645 [Thermodesulfobacteriota bacterium]